MVIDTSALLAILLPEPDALTYEAPLAHAPKRAVSAASLLETGMVLIPRRGKEKAMELPAWLAAFGIDIHPVTPGQAMLAMEAFERYGKGRHKAALNFGDCFAYALAKTLNARLLFKGQDFTHTDIEPAIL